jgi:SOS response associated peptidase (SRAP)
VYRREPKTGARVEGHLKWGLAPHSADRWPDFRPIHAPAETIHEQKLFREAFRKRRLIAPINAFYQKDASGRRHAITRTDGKPFGVAGIWENWRNPRPASGNGPSRSSPYQRIPSSQQSMTACWRSLSRRISSAGSIRMTMTRAISLNRIRPSISPSRRSANENDGPDDRCFMRADHRERPSPRYARKSNALPRLPERARCAVRPQSGG